CGNILIHGTYLKCNSGTRNSFTYDPIPESFDEVQIIPNPPPQCHFNIYLCHICESNSHYGYECSQRVSLVYEPEPCYTQNISDNALIDHHYCYKCGNSLNGLFLSSMHLRVLWERLWGSPESYHCQPLQYTVNHPIFNAHNDLLNYQNKLMEKLKSMCDMVGQYIQKKEEEKQIKEEQAAKAQNWKLSICYDDDDDEERSNSLKDNIISGLPPCAAITPISSTEEPVDSLIMEDEHLDTIPAMKSDEFIKSSVEDLVSNPSESEGKHEYASKKFFSNPLFDEEIISTKIDPHHFNAESDLIKSLLNHDPLIIFSSSKIDPLFDEFAGELTLLKAIPSGINETDCDPEEETRFTKRLLYDNSFLRPPEEIISENYDPAIESFSPSPIPVEDNDSLMEEINLSFTPDYPMPPGIEEDDYDSERDILILEELLSNNSISLPENESFNFDIPLFSRPPAKPPDGNIGILNVKVMGDISEHKVPMPRLMFTQPTLVPNQEKYPDLLPYQGHEAFQPSAECPMMIH
nr:hypothetical protein [Tanacetum cinerariifolium]